MKNLFLQSAFVVSFTLTTGCSPNLADESCQKVSGVWTLQKVSCDKTTTYPNQNTYIKYTMDLTNDEKVYRSEIIQAKDGTNNWFKKSSGYLLTRSKSAISFTSTAPASLCSTNFLANSNWSYSPTEHCQQNIQTPTTLSSETFDCSVQDKQMKLMRTAPILGSICQQGAEEELIYTQE